jgi:hypothetical protein
MGSDQFLKQTINLTIFIYTNSLGGWMSWQTWHSHDFTTNDDNKARACANPYFANRNHMPSWRPT